MRALPPLTLPLALALSACPAFATLDSDNDQLSDVWRARYNATALSATTDDDGDGYSNLQESILGTDPRDRASRLAHTVRVLPDAGLEIEWTAVRGKRYAVETSVDLVNWTTLQTLSGREGPQRTLAPSGPSRFVRVRTEDIDSDGDGLADWEELATGFNPARTFSEGLGNSSTSPTSRVTDFERLRSTLTASGNTVTIAAMDPALAENWPDPGLVVVRRTGRLDPIVVNVSLGGTATMGQDYATPVSLSVALPFGADAAVLALHPLADALAESDETIVVTLQPGAGYTLGATSAATLVIADASDGRLAEKDAARFLAQATFGPTPAELARVRQLGHAAWLDAQFARPVGLHLPIVATWQTELAAPTTPTAPAVGVDHRLEAWWRQALRDDPGSDPLRQRVAFALSQIFVISDRMSSLANDQRGMTSYQDTLLTYSFGNYRDLLEAVTRHPWMGLYLSALRNRKANPALNRFPDENYAREVMQLFSIGLWRLAPDGTRLLSDGTALDPDGVPVPAGQPIPTYGETQIGALARVLTGLSYGTRFTSSTNITEIPTTRFSDSNNVPWGPMRMWDVEHDVAAKTFWLPGLPALQLPARTASTSPDTGAAGDADLDAALDYLCSHPNVGPFIGRLLIQRLVTSNPTPAYIARISAVFANNGQGVRGDLRAVIRAILLDPEARDPARISEPAHGLVREPYTRYVALARGLGHVPPPDGRYRGFSGLDADVLQRPLSAPSVFNFYSPDYRAPGPLSDATLVAPELQIINSVTTITGPNRVSTALAVTSTSANATRLNANAQSDDLATPDFDESLRNTRVDEAPWLVLATGDPDALVSALDRALCGGTMGPVTFRAITRAVRRLSDPAASGITDTERDNRIRQRFRVAAHLAAICPEASVLK
ncbi:MAG: DUF1800 family protein [Opitutaceae bacterium]|jgi:uncharacterized protein (DUF1800 family)|nr:DUF1800 family protein [Opitutaceae bacterium]